MPSVSAATAASVKAGLCANIRSECFRSLKKASNISGPLKRGSLCRLIAVVGGRQSPAQVLDARTVLVVWTGAQPAALMGDTEGRVTGIPLRPIITALAGVLLLLLIWPGGVPDPFGVTDEYAWIVLTWSVAVPLALLCWWRNRSLRTPLDVWIGAYVAVAILTWPTSTDRTATAIAIAGLIGQIGVYYATFGVAREWKHSPPLILAALVVGIAVIQLQAVDFHVEQGLLTRPKVYERPPGWSGYPEISHLAVVQIAILIAFLQTAATWSVVAAVSVLIAVGSVELGLLYARLAWLSLGAVLVAAGIVAFREGRRLMVIGLLGLGVCGGGLLVWKNPTIQQLVYGTVGLSLPVVDPSAPYLEIATPDMRFSIWQRTVRMIGDHWLTGVGLGNFRPVYESFYNPEVNNDGRRGTHAHNYWLQQAAELGVAGGVANVTLWIGGLWIAWRRRTSSVAHRAVLYVLVAITARHLADNLFFSFGFASARLQSLAWLALALAVIPDHAGEIPAERSCEDAPDRLPPPHRPLSQTQSEAHEKQAAGEREAAGGLGNEVTERLGRDPGEPHLVADRRKNDRTPKNPARRSGDEIPVDHSPTQGSRLLGL